MTRTCRCFRSALLTLAVVCGVVGGGLGRAGGPVEAVRLPGRGRPAGLRHRRPRQPRPRLLALRLRAAGRRSPTSRSGVVVPPGEGDDGPRIQAAIDYVSKLAAGRGRLPRCGAAARRPARGRGPTPDRGRAASSCAAQGQDTVLVATGTDRRTLIQMSRARRTGRSEEAARRRRRRTSRSVRTRLRLESADGAEGRRRGPGRAPGDEGVDRRRRHGPVPVAGQGLVPRLAAGHARRPLGPRSITADRRRHGHARRPADHGPRRGPRRRHGAALHLAGAGAARRRREPAAASRRSTRPTRTTRSTPGAASAIENAEDVLGAAGDVRPLRRVGGRGVGDGRAGHGRGLRVGPSRSPRSAATAGTRSSPPGSRRCSCRCKAEHGRHDFAVGHLAAGPNAFVHCKATNAHRFSGPIESWASGRAVRQRHDRRRRAGADQPRDRRPGRRLGGGELACCGSAPPRSSPAGCRRRRRTGRSACWGQFVGDGHWRQLNEFVKPDSLYAAQLADRLGDKAAEVLKRRAIPTDAGRREDDRRTGAEARKPPPAPPRQPLALTNGWLVGRRQAARPAAGSARSWWRGQRPAVAGRRSWASG